MMVLCGPQYPSERCKHAAPAARRCPTCATWEIERDFPAVPRIGEKVRIWREEMLNAAHRAGKEESDLWVVTDVWWGEEVPYLCLDWQS